jgi:S-adenosylmethionine hydrolase
MSEHPPARSGKGVTRAVPVITLLSDFGTRDPYVASMKGVILSICRNAKVVDITHNIAKFNVSQGGYALAAVISYFQPGTIHVCVVDPGVGTKRKALLVRTKRSNLIGPDNGVLMPAASREGIERVIEIKNSKYMLDEVSPTFHGRDVFCAVAAHLANGVPMKEFGPETDEYIQPSFSKPTVSGGNLLGEVIHLDDFGNVVTNISLAEIGKLGIMVGATLRLVLGSTSSEMRFGRTYGEVAVGQPLSLIGSTGLLEISINRGNAASTYKAQEGSKVTISRN